MALDIAVHGEHGTRSVECEMLPEWSSAFRPHERRDELRGRCDESVEAVSDDVRGWHGANVGEDDVHVEATGGQCRVSGEEVFLECFFIFGDTRIGSLPHEESEPLELWVAGRGLHADLI